MEQHTAPIAKTPGRSSRAGKMVLGGLFLAGALVLTLWGWHWNHNRHLAPPNATVTRKISMQDCLALLQNSKPALVEAVRAALTGQQGAPELLLISYRQVGDEIRDVVVQVYETPTAGAVNILNPDGVVHARLGDELFGSAESFMQLIYNPVSFSGEQEEVDRQQRAFQAAVEGDLTLLREQTVEPLHVMAIMPCADRYLPGSLKSRVQSLVVDSELTFGEWRSQVALVTDGAQTAQQVGNTIAAWREMAVTLANTYAKHSSGQPLRDSLQASIVQVSNNRVLASGKMPSKTVVRVAKEFAGYGGQKCCSHGCYKKSSNWPSGVSSLTLGCQSYSKSDCLSLLTMPSGGDASIILAHQLIAAKLNQIFDLPATAAQVNAIAVADSLLCSYSGKLPYHVPSGSPAGQQMVNVASILDAYNNSCHTGGGGAQLVGGGPGLPGGTSAGGGGSGGIGGGAIASDADGGGTGGGVGPLDHCSPGYFKQANHWPTDVDSLKLGEQHYSKDDSISVLSRSNKGDASIKLGQQLIASKLNEHAGLAATPEQLQAMADADALLGSYAGKLGYEVPSNSPVGIQMNQIAQVLDGYNNSCHVSGSAAK